MNHRSCPPMSATTTTPAPVPPKRRRLRRILLFLGLIGIVVIISGYFVLSSSAFLKRIVVPRVGHALNADITVDEVGLRPFSQLVVRNLRVVPRGEEELLRLREARVDYSLLRILRGNLEIESVVLDSPRLTITRSADGRSNHDPLLESSGRAEPEESAAGPAPRFRLGRLEVRNATLSYRQETSTNQEFEAQLDMPRFVLSNLANGETAQAEVETAVRFISREDSTKHELAGTLSGTLTTVLNNDLLPERLEGRFDYHTTTATGAFSRASGLAAALRAKVTPTQVETLALDFVRGQLPLGRLSVTGPFDVQQLEGNLHCEVAGIGPEVLSLFGGQYGLGFGETRLTAAFDLRVTDRARSVQVAGTLKADRFSLVMDQLATPALDLSLSEDVTADLSGSSLSLDRLEFGATQGGQPRLTANLERPTRIEWEKGLDGLQDSAFELGLTNLDFADWQALLGPEIKAGKLAGKLGLEVRNAGREIGVSLASSLKGLTSTFGSAKVEDFGVALDVLATVTNQVMVFREANLTLPQTPLAANRITMTGRIDAQDPEHIGGHLQLASEALDLTPQLAWFEEAPAEATPVEPTPGEEPAPTESLILPLKAFVAEATVGKLHAGELLLTNVQTRILLDGGKVVINPLTLACNGSPARGSMRLDMTSPAWGYDLDLDARNVPLAPLVNTFQPERKGVVGGTISAVGRIKGAGFTGDELRQNLHGSFDLGTTNLALKLVDVKNPLIRAVAGVATELPGLIRNPADALAGLVGRLAGGGEGGGDPAWLNTLSQPPINVIAIQGGAGNGRIDLTTATLQTPAFRVGTHGTVTLASPLMDSAISLPVQMSLSRPLAATLGQVPANTPTNQAFVPLPEFFSLGGTLGEPKRELKAMVLAQMGATSAANLSGDSSGVAQQIGGALKILEDLTGGSGDGGKTTTTNALPALEGLLEGIQKATGAGSTRTNKSALDGILNGILSPRTSGGSKGTNAVPQQRGETDPAQP